MSPQVPIWAVSKTLKTTTHKTLCRLGPEPQSNTMVISKFLRYFKIRIVRVTLLPKAHKKASWSIDWTPRLPFTNLWGSKQILEAGAPTPQPLNQPRTHPHYQVPTEDHRIRKHSTVEAFFSHTLFFCKLYNGEVALNWASCCAAFSVSSRWDPESWSWLAGWLWSWILVRSWRVTNN